MDIEELDINAVCFGILCNFTPVCGEERAKEAVELVRTLQAENEKLRADLEQVKQDRRRPGQAGCVQVGHKWGISMGDCVRIEEYRRTCANCYWHDAAMWACKRPGKGKEKLNMKNKDLRRLRCLVKAQTLWHLERLAYLDGCGDVGRMVDKLTRDKVLALRQSVVGPWAAHHVARAKRVD